METKIRISEEAKIDLLMVQETLKPDVLNGLMDGNPIKTEINEIKDMIEKDIPFSHDEIYELLKKYNVDLNSSLTTLFVNAVKIAKIKSERVLLNAIIRNSEKGLLKYEEMADKDDVEVLGSLGHRELPFTMKEYNASELLKSGTTLSDIKHFIDVYDNMCKETYTKINDSLKYKIITNIINYLNNPDTVFHEDASITLDGKTFIKIKDLK